MNTLPGKLKEGPSEASACPGPMAMEKEVNSVPAKLKEGPGRGSDPEVMAHEYTGSISGAAGFRTKGNGKTFKDRREEIRRKG